MPSFQEGWLPYCLSCHHPHAKPIGNGDKDIGDQAIPPKRKNRYLFIPPESTQKHNTLEGAQIICPFQILLADLFFTLVSVSLEDCCPFEPGGVEGTGSLLAPAHSLSLFPLCPDLTAQANLGVVLKVLQLLHNGVQRQPVFPGRASASRTASSLWLQRALRYLWHFGFYSSAISRPLKNNFLIL